MIVRPTEEQLRAMLKLSTDDDGKLFLSWIQACYDATKESLVNELNDVQFRIAQGEARELKAVLDGFTMAESALRAIRKK